jgi:hypothetical protein
MHDSIVNSWIATFPQHCLQWLAASDSPVHMALEWVWRNLNRDLAPLQQQEGRADHFIYQCIVLNLELV